MPALQSVFFDTQIIRMASDGRLAPEPWNDLIGAVQRKYEYRVSFTTFLELLNALAGSDEEHFDDNRKRLDVLTSVPGYKFLPMPGQFIRTEVLGLSLERPEYSPNTLIHEWLPLIRRAQTKDELVTGVSVHSYGKGAKLVKGINLASIRKYMDNGKNLWVEELRLAKENAKEMPPPDLHAAFIIEFDANTEPTPARVATVGPVIDASYCHLAHIHHESTKSGYRFDTKPQDWIDNQQLIYLADANCTFVTGDGKLRSKLGKSTQATRVRMFEEFEAAP